MPVDKFGNEVKQRGSVIKSDEGISLSFANNTYIRLDGESDITGNLNMALRKIENLGDPTNPKDATSKEYVDNTKGTGIIGELKDETATIKGNLDFTGKYRLKNLPDPIDGNDAANRKFVNENGAFVFRNNEYYAKGNIYLRNAKLGGLREPTQDGEATTKKYVDELIFNQFVDGNDNIAFGRNVDMEGKKIFDLPLPKQDDEPATKKYVDDSQIYEIDRRGNVKFDRNINLDNKRIFAMKEPKKDGEGANKKYVDDAIEKKIQEEKDNFLPKDAATKNYVDEAIKQVAGGDILVSKEGVFIKDNGHYRATAPIDIDNQKVENIPDPVDEKDAVNRKYVDEIVEGLTLKQGLIRENGGFNLVDSYINMNFNTIRNVGTPQSNTDAVPRKVVDDVEKNLEEKVQKVEEKINRRKHLIAASASYHGDLIKDFYQFTWNSKNANYFDDNNIFNGFLVPGRGRIKKFIIFETGLKINIPEPKTFSEFVNSDFGFKNPFPMFTLVLIRQEQNHLDIGTLYFQFETREDIIIVQSFKFNSNFDEEILRTVNAKDIINIRTEFSNLTLNKKFRTFTQIKGYNLKNIDDDFFTYLATVLIELDPLDD